ncbi:MAG: hypothetical protein WCO00_06445 [Rhodospirillaceae bacterium]
MERDNRPTLVLTWDVARDKRGVGEGQWGYRPEPPKADVLETPLFLTKPPRIILPETGWLQRRMERFAIWQRPELRLKRRLHGMIATVMASVAPRTVWNMEKTGRIYAPGQKKASLGGFRITHPYQLADIFKELITARDRHLLEYKAIEILLSMILREYIKTSSLIREKKFSFEAEAREHGFRGAHLERQLKIITHPGEREGIIRTIHDSYFHTINYYIYSLLSREPLKNDGSLFSLYCRALFFMARLDEHGAMQDKASRRNLPRRKDVLYLVVRDQALRERYNRDREYAMKIKEVVRFFPSDQE